MLEKMKNDITIVEEKSVKNTRLYIRNANVNEESYETKMLLEENIDGVLKFQIGYEGEQSVLCFDVSGTISFEEYLKTNKLKKNDICDIIDAIDSLLSSIENYLILENSISLDLRLIRIERNARGQIKYKFIVIPDYNSSFSYELSKFLIRILRHVDIDDKDALRLGYGLFVRSSKDNYTINDLIDLVDIVRDRKKDAIKEIDAEALSAYDEEIVSEMENLTDDEINVEEYEESYPADMTKITKNDGQMDIVMDKNTSDMLKDELFDNFDEEDMAGDKKIIKFKKKMFNVQKKKALNGHIAVNAFKTAIIPFACLIVPMLFYLLYGLEKMSKYLPVICLYEILLLIIYVVNSIKNSKSA